MLLAVVFAFLLSAFSIRWLVVVAPKVGLIDKPGGHKRHDRHIPIVGGLGIYLGVLAVIPLLMWTTSGMTFLVFIAAASLLLFTGLLDDVHQLGVRIRFAIQCVAALMMIYGGGVVLTDFGTIVNDELVLLGMFAVPVTIFATCGVINALNMIDGIDGLAGALSVVCLVFLGYMVAIAGRYDYLLFILGLASSIIGFLLYNFRHPGQPMARVFMGDAGSTLLGFTFAWLMISLTQGENRAMAPVTSLWIFAVPLMETVSVMLRRVVTGNSPFKPDHSHLHHMLVDAGFRVSHAVTVIIGLQVVLASIGIAGHFYGISETFMFYSFLFIWLLHFFLISLSGQTVHYFRKWHRALDFTVADVQQIYIGNLPKTSAASQVNRLLGVHRATFSLRDHLTNQHGEPKKYAIVEVSNPQRVQDLLKQLRARRTAEEASIVIRQYIPRKTTNCRRTKDNQRNKNRRATDRRGQHNTVNQIKHEQQMHLQQPNQ